MCAAEQIIFHRNKTFELVIIKGSINKSTRVNRFL